MVHICITVALSSKVLLHPFHVNHSWTYQPFWHFYILPPMFHEVDQFYLLAAKYQKGQILQRMRFNNVKQEDLFHQNLLLIFITAQTLTSSSSLLFLVLSIRIFFSSSQMSYENESSVAAIEPVLSPCSWFHCSSTLFKYLELFKVTSSCVEFRNALNRFQHHSFFSFGGISGTALGSATSDGSLRTFSSSVA